MAFKLQTWKKSVFFLTIFAQFSSTVLLFLFISSLLYIYLLAYGHFSTWENCYVEANINLKVTSNDREICYR